METVAKRPFLSLIWHASRREAAVFPRIICYDVGVKSIRSHDAFGFLRVSHS